MERPFDIRPARADELPALPAIERAAAHRFAGLGLIDHLLNHTLSTAELGKHQAQGRVWVASAPDGRLAGFAVALELDGMAHLDELDVLPEFGRRGVGARLVETVCRWATARGLPAVTLSTFRDVPWNAPFYRRLGFRTLAPHELGPALLAIRERENRLGVPVAKRVVMRRELAARNGLPDHLVLYDGDCGLCSRTVRWLLDVDRQGVLRFAAQQGETAAAVRSRHPELPADLDGIIYVEQVDGGERVSWNSEAMLRVCARVGGFWRAVSWLGVLPRVLTDFVYRQVASRRHRLFGPPQSCHAPTAEERARFLP